MQWVVNFCQCVAELAGSWSGDPLTFLPVSAFFVEVASASNPKALKSPDHGESPADPCVLLFVRCRRRAGKVNILRLSAATDIKAGDGLARSLTGGA